MFYSQLGSKMILLKTDKVRFFNMTAYRFFNITKMFTYNPIQ